MMTAPRIQLNKLSGPAIFDACRAPNNQPEPIMLVVLAKSRLMMPASRRRPVTAPVSDEVAITNLSPRGCCPLLSPLCAGEQTFTSYPENWLTP